MNKSTGIFLGLKNYAPPIFSIIICAVAYILVCVPAFTMTGSIVKPLCLAFFVPALFTIPYLIKKETGLLYLGVAQIILVLFWVIFAIIKELQLNSASGWVGYWIEFFYFDKILMLGSVWLSSTLTVTAARLINKKTQMNYSLFFKLSSAAFLIFYTSLLIYSFVLIRLEQGDFPLSLMPFATIKVYISDWQTIPYEVFMMFFGNLLYFTPLGFIFYVLLRKRSIKLRIAVIFLFPIFAFSLLEASQYIFQNGFCETDDMLMNTLGFWFGAALCKAADKIAAFVTQKRLDTFWF